MLNIAQDDRGFIFSTDLLLALIVLTVILGLSAEVVDTVSYKMQDYGSRNSLERLAHEGADILIKSPGSPDNWEELNVGEIKYPGLSRVDYDHSPPEGHLLSYKKILKLKKDYGKIIPGNFFPSYLDCSIVIYPVDNALDPLVIHDSSQLSLSKEVVVVNRSVLCDYRSQERLLYMNINPDSVNPDPCFIEKCHQLNHGIEDGEDYWICRNFRIERSRMKDHSYYLINTGTAPHTYWILDQSYHKSNHIRGFNNHPFNLDNDIKSLSTNLDYEVFYLHINLKKEFSGSFEIFVVEVPVDTPLDELKSEFFQIQPCYFVLKAGLKN
ncbi:MAG: hypothetical protein KKF16_09715 [Euryarchaeota archaeon]|nr:hypothetical protein [Euryarchaeota archaeon]MBU4607993.1 hypothetical protein [Euryarchaeota archaeon]MBV1728988.1 hypothetical protein [Methanobacterium sp.]MBV1755205.1 hypothetical protein [Methanobacterium sp.]